MSRSFHKVSFLALTLLLLASWSLPSQAAIIYDSATQGSWRAPSVVYGSDGYILPAFDAGNANRVSLPSYISSWSTTGALYNNGVQSIQDPANTSLTNSGIVYSNTASSFTVTLTPNVTKDFKLALYLGGFYSFMSETISFSGTNNSIAPQVVGYWEASNPNYTQATNTTAFPANTTNQGLWVQYDINAIANQNIVISVAPANVFNQSQFGALAFDSIVPEPSTLAMFWFGSLFALFFARRRTR